MQLLFEGSHYSRWCLFEEIYVNNLHVHVHVHVHVGCDLTLDWIDHKFLKLNFLCKVRFYVV